VISGLSSICRSPLAIPNSKSMRLLIALLIAESWANASRVLASAIADGLEKPATPACAPFLNQPTTTYCRKGLHGGTANGATCPPLLRTGFLRLTMIPGGIWIRLLLAQAKATTLPLSPQFVICTARHFWWKYPMTKSSNQERSPSLPQLTTASGSMACFWVSPSTPVSGI